MNKKNQTHIAYGVVTALAMIIIGVILEVTKLSYKPGLKYVSILAFLIGIILNAQAFSKANAADITFGQAFSSCFKMTAIIAIIMFVWSFIVIMIFPNMLEQSLEQARTEMANNPKLSEEQVDMAMNITRKYFKPLLHAGALFGTLFMGLIFSLIAAAIAKKAPRQQIQMQ